MATGTLTGQTIANTYKSLLKITGTDAGGTTLAADAVIVIEDGDGNPSSLSLSQQRATITLGSGAADDFIVDGTALVVEGDNHRVGIGTAAPSNQLHLESATSTTMLMKNTGNSGSQIDGDANRSSADSTIMGIVGKWNGTAVADILIVSGADTTNKDDGDIVFRTAPSGTVAERMRIEKDGTVVMKGATQFEGNTTITADNARFGVGGSASGHWASGFDVLSVGHATQIACETADSGDRNAFWTSNLYYDGTGSGDNVYRRLYTDEASMIQQRAGFIAFFTDASGTADADFAPSERARLLTTGSLCIARATVLSPAAKLVVASALDGSTTPAASFQANTSTSSGAVVVFHSGDGSEAGSITLSNLNAADAVAYGTSSDYRLKEKVKTLPNGLDRVNQLKPVEFEWKKTKTKSEGFLAHELQEICDYAVIGEKDGMQDILYQEADEIPEGKEIGDVKESIVKAQQADYAKITPILVKAVQELSAKVKALEDA